MDTMEPKACYKDLLVRKLIDEFSRRNIEGYYCETKSDVLGKIVELIPKNSVVSCGGSATVHEIGVRNILKNEDYVFLDPDDAQGGKAKEEIARRALDADYYLMSANAISVTGEIVNLDGIGNRVAALSFGPKNVIVIVGLNKVAPNVDAAILRAKTCAAPLTLLIFKRDYPSYDALCAAAEKAYSQLVITSMSTIKGRIKVILVGEDLGF